MPARGPERFGWADGNQEPGSRREGIWLIGHGMAGGYRGAPSQASGVRVTLTPEGNSIVETEMNDIDTGSYMIIGQSEAEMPGLSADQVELRLGDSSYHAAAESAG